MCSYGNILLTTTSTKFLGKIPCSPVSNCPLSQSSPIRDISIIKEPSLKDNSSDDTKKNGLMSYLGTKITYCLQSCSWLQHKDLQPRERKREREKRNRQRQGSVCVCCIKHGETNKETPYHCILSR